MKWVLYSSLIVCLASCQVAEKASDNADSSTSSERLGDGSGGDGPGSHRLKIENVETGAIVTSDFSHRTVLSLGGDNGSHQTVIRVTQLGDRRFVVERNVIKLELGKSVFSGLSRILLRTGETYSLAQEYQALSRKDVISIVSLSE